ncbi:MAG: anaerobic ribonucleoside-triphosphate reductase [Candidatus Thorarchaeota archaeon]
MTDSTDKSLFTKTSDDRILEWDKYKIIKSLEKETGLPQTCAKAIANEIEGLIKYRRLKVVTTTLIRELVNAELINRGFVKERNKYCRLGMPISDVKDLIIQCNKENANVPHNPEATNLTIAGNIKKEFALLEIFPDAVSKAHLRGDIHLHDLDYIDRPYCGGQNLEYIKKFGLNLPNALSIAKPARHPEVLLLHLMKFSAALQGCFAGAIGWDAINVFIAPYLLGYSYKEIKQLAQILIFEFSQQAVARGGQAIFSDINLYWEVPKHFANVEAIGPGGEYTGDKYKYYEFESHKFIKAIFETYLEGDGSGRPFMWPKPNLHITEKFFETKDHEEFLELASDVAAKMGNTYFIFDRGQKVKISECCRLSLVMSKKDLEETNQPWKMRFSALQNVTINLPRIIYESKGNFEKTIKILSNRMELAAKAHVCKRKFIEKLLSKKHNGPLSLLAMDLDGESYLRLHKATHLIGMVGLNEAVKAYSGQELHENNTALMDGLRLISLMHDISKELSKKYGINFVLEQTPAESTSYRFAKLDIDNFPDALNFTRGDSKDSQVYYTNSTQLSVASNIDPIKRVSLEGKFHPLIEAGSMTHLWIGEYKPDKKAIASFVKTVFKNTSNDQICFSPEFTSCKKCFKTSRGLNEKCIYCGSNEVDGITRITGYFAKTSGFNPGKIAELKDRKKWRV